MSTAVGLASFSLDVPREWLLTANQRMHWRAKARRSAWLRQAAGIRALQIGGTFLTPVRCEISVAWPNARRRDVHNLMPTIKPVIDGAVDAGLLQDDSDQWLIGPDLRVADEKCSKDLACSLQLRFEVPR